jgi:hypothetical protein
MSDLDRILSSEPAVTPSASFASRVMSAVRSEAAVPAPIAFPWRRVAPVLVVCGAALAVACVLFAMMLTRSNAPLDALAHGVSVPAVKALWTSGLPLAVGTVFGGWLLFRLSSGLRRPGGSGRS